jgi:hypothetical protein
VVLPVLMTQSVSSEQVSRVRSYTVGGTLGGAQLCSCVYGMAGGTLDDSCALLLNLSVACGMGMFGGVLPARGCQARVRCTRSLCYVHKVVCCWFESGGVWLLVTPVWQWP